MFRDGAHVECSPVPHGIGAAAMFDEITLERFWSKVDKSAGPNECWPWIAGKHRHGYGVIGIGDKTYLAHRISLQIATGEAGKVARHLCDNPPCVNPTHLLWGTHDDNMKDHGFRGKHHNSAKTHCAKGHPYSPENTRYFWGKSGKHQRICRTCSNTAALRIYYERKAGIKSSYSTRGRPPHQSS